MGASQGSEVFLCSLQIGMVADQLSDRRVGFVPTAANGLADRAEVIDAVRLQLVALGIDPVELDLDRVQRVTVADLGAFDAIVVGGGDPYRLLAAARRTAFDHAVRDAVARGLAYVGVSAGALAAGPSLEPIRDVTPFDRPPDLDPTALDLVPLLALPHDARPGRRDRHAAAMRAHGRTHRLIALDDDEALAVDSDTGWRLLNACTPTTIRPAAATDAGDIAATYVEAGRAAWTFVDDQRFAGFDAPVAAWSERLAGRDDPDDVLVAVDPHGVCGFVWVRAATDDDLDATFGEVGAFYTRPRVWGGGVGRRLLRLGLDRLRSRGAEAAVLYTEERNTRPRRVYERDGWRPDGTSRDREFLGVGIREIRYRRPL